MADLSDVQAAQSVKLVGADSVGVEGVPVTSTANGALQVNLRNAAGTEIATASNPTRIDPTGTTTQPVSDAGGSLTVDGTVSAVQSGTWNVNNVSGTVSLPTGAATSANQTTEITSLQLIDNPIGSVAAGAAGTNSFLIGGVFNTALPTVTNGQQVALQLDSSGRQIVSPLTNTSVVKAQVQDDSGNGISSSSNGLSANRLLHVRVPDTTVSSASLGSLNASISITTAGLPGVGFQITAGTLIGTLTPESSIDDGTTWVASSFIDPTTNNLSSSLTFSSANTTKILSIIPLNGASTVRVRVSAYTSGTASSLLRASAIRGSGQSVSTVQIVSSLPAASITSSALINTGVTNYTSYTATQQLALKQFYAAGTGIGQQKLFYYSPSTTQFVNAGNFETASDVNTVWIWTSGGAGSIASSTTQAFTGTRSVALTFTNSSGASAQGVKQTFSTAVDMSGWRYITSEFYNVLSAGGAYTRTISIILTDTSGSTYKYDLSGLSTATPFSVSGWIKLTGEITNPTSVTGTGFDLTKVASLELRMADSANKAGTVYWDTVQLESQMTLIIPIFHTANTSTNVVIDPVAVLNSGSQVIIAQTNADTARKEYFALVGGVGL